MEETIKMLVIQLLDNGMKEAEISSCISSLWSIVADPDVMCSEDLNLQMREAGWQNFELDDEAFRMVSSAFTL